MMIWLNRPLTMPVWQVALLLILLCLLGASVWYFSQGSWRTAVSAALLLLLFIVGDIIILSHLPQRRISFSSWKAQVLFLAIPRVIAALGAGLLSFWVDPKLALLLFLLLQLAGTVLLIWGAHIEPASLQLTYLDIAARSLPGDAQAVRILHITDLHIERLSRRETDLLVYIAESEPDLILITGDYVNLSFNLDPQAYREIKIFLSQLAAPYGIYAVLGTPTVDLWEFVTPLFDEGPVTLLRDQLQEIDLGSGRLLTLLGLNCTHEMEEDGARLKTMVAAAPANGPRILLYHSPELMPQAHALGIELYLCGHTHGGQVRLPLFGPLLTSSALGRRYVMGHYRDGATNLYVSRGVGLEGLSAPRVRLLTPPEVTLITMRPG